MVLIRTAMFCFDKLHFLLVVGDIPKLNFLGIPDSDFLVDKVGFKPTTSEVRAN